MSPIDVILKAVYEESIKEKPNLGSISAHAVDLDPSVFKETVLFLEKDGYLTNVKKSKGGRGKKVLLVWFNYDTALTKKAADHLVKIL
jgi:hypothetical protein